MVRLPPGFHYQAVRNGNELANLPGRRGSGMQPIRVTPVVRYRRRITQIPLTGGQAQGAFPSGSLTGSVTSPSTFQIFANLFPLPAGTYTVAWTVTLGGTVGAADANNFGLTLGSGPTLAAPSVNAGAVGTYVQTAVTFTITGTDSITLKSWSSTPTTGAVYGGTITITTASLTLTVGPQGLGNIWYPAQLTVSTTTGPLDTSTCLLYLGALGVPITLIGTVYSGNGTVAAAVPPMQPGQFIIAKWSNGHAGDIAAVNVAGLMDALSE